MKEYEYFEHQADVGIIGFGKTLEESFENGAKAMFQIMVELNSVNPVSEVKIRASADDVEALFVEWLNELLAQKDIKNMMFSEFKVKINDGNLEGVARGETLDLNKHKLKTEVKAASYSQLRVEKTEKGFKAQCVVDV